MVTDSRYQYFANCSLVVFMFPIIQDFFRGRGILFSDLLWIGQVQVFNPKPILGSHMWNHLVNICLIPTGCKSTKPVLLEINLLENENWN